MQVVAGDSGRFVDSEWTDLRSISALWCEAGIREEPLEVGAGNSAPYPACYIRTNCSCMRMVSCPP